jgi:glutamate synthase domain-containing protein 1
MCGIVGLFLKEAGLQPHLGALMADMLAEMTERGPDSAGFAVYRDGPPRPTLSCLAPQGFDWDDAAAGLSQAIGSEVAVERISDHALLRVSGDLRAARHHLIAAFPEIDVLSSGEAIEIFKGVGDPDGGGADLRAGAALGHARHRPYPHGDRKRGDDLGLAPVLDRSRHLPCP